MNTLYKNLAEQTNTAKENLEEVIKLKYPALTTITIYSPNDMYLATTYHSTNIYAHQARKSYIVSLLCNSQSNQGIPTDKEALAHVHAMRTDKKQMSDILDDIYTWFSNKDD